MVDKTEDIEIRLLLEALFQKYHFDFRGYAHGFAEAAAEAGARATWALRPFPRCRTGLLHDSAMLPKLVGYLTVQVSEMFRDPAYFRAIRERVVPHLRTYPSLKVWVAGCSAGEELYSFVILFREEGLENRTLFYATDINQEALRKPRPASTTSIASNCSPKTIASRAESPRCRTITPRPMAAPPSARAFASAWCFPTTAW